jgi:hypothetical protein
MEQEKIEKAKGQQADNRGFFAKYVSDHLLFEQPLFFNGSKYVSKLTKVLSRSRIISLPRSALSTEVSYPFVNGAQL